MEFLLANWQPILGGLGSALGVGGWLWGRKIKKSINAWADVVTVIIEARRDGKYTDEEIKDIMNATVKALISLFPFYRKYREMNK